MRDVTFSLSRTLSLLLLASFLFLSRNIYRPTEPLITFIGFRAGFGRIRRSSLSLPINLERSIGCGFVKRPDEISQSTAEQWASMTRSCLVGSASTVPFPFFWGRADIYIPFSERLLCFLFVLLITQRTRLKSNVFDNILLDKNSQLVVK